MSGKNDRSCYSMASKQTSLNDIRRSMKKIDKENFDETFDSYSILFDKNKHDFSTSSEVSLLDRSDVSNLLTSINNENTMIEEIRLSNDQSSDSDETFLSAQSSIDQEDDEENEKSLSTNNGMSIDARVNSVVCRDFEVENNSLNIINDSDQLKQKQKQVERPENRDIDRQKTNRSIDFKQNFVDRDDDEDDRAFQQFLIEHRNSTNNTNQENQHNQRPKRSCQIRRNSLKDFICDSSSEDDDSDSLYRRVDRLLDEDTLWREQDEKYQSYSSDEYSSKTSSSDDDNDDDGQKPRLTTEKPKTNIDFLESLSNHIPIIEKHPDAKQYFLRSGFKTNKKRQELAEKLFSIFDRDIFSSKLSSKVTIVWSGRLTATAGHCTTRRSTLTATITLSNKVCDSPERCRDTLIHELCHAAVSLIDCVIEHGHGQLWRNWTKKAEKFYPYLPPISVKHTYEVNYKFIYRCLKCKYEVPRHSKSLNVNTDLCGKCLGQFELIINQNQNQNQNQQEKTNQTPKRTPNRYNLFVKEHFQTLKQSQPHLSTPQLMKELGQKYKKKIQEENQIDLPDFDQLKISI